MRCTSLVISVAVVVTLGFPGLAWAVDSNNISPSSDVQSSPDGSRQPDAVPNCDLQGTLDALSSPELASRSAEDNGKLLSKYLGCGGTIASLPQEIFATLLRQGVIELDIVNGGSGAVACPATGEGACSNIPG